MKKSMVILCAMLLVFGMVGVAGATLIKTGTVNYAGADRKLIYDDDLDITWLDYSNGGLNWDDQMAWAIDLSFTINNMVYDDWRLPEIGSAPNTGYDNPSTEFGHLFYTELGNTHANRMMGNPYLENTGPFENLVEYSWYWTGTEDPIYSDIAWYVSTADSLQNGYFKFSSTNLGLAVMDGQVSPVPEPSTMLLLGTGLIGLAGFRRKFRKR